MTFLNITAIPTLHLFISLITDDGPLSLDSSVQRVCYSNTTGSFFGKFHFYDVSGVLAWVAPSQTKSCPEPASSLD